MNLALWIIASALAVVFALSGLMKLGVSKDKLPHPPVFGAIRLAHPSDDCGGR